MGFWIDKGVWKMKKGVFFDIKKEKGEGGWCFGGDWGEFDKGVDEV